MSDAELARDIRHAIAEEMAAAGLLWGGRQDYAVGVALKRVSLPTQPVATTDSAEETRAQMDALIARVHTFADQLLAWGHGEAAAQVRREILQGPVETDQQYQTLLAVRAALARRCATLEKIRIAAMRPSTFHAEYVRIVREEGKADQ